MLHVYMYIYIYMRVMLIVRISLALKKKFNKSLVPLWIEIFHSNLLSLNLFVQINTQNRHLFAKSNTRSLLVMARWLKKKTRFVINLLFIRRKDIAKKSWERRPTDSLSIAQTA